MLRVRTIGKGAFVAGVAATVLAMTSATADAADICSGLASAIARTGGLARAILEAIARFFGC